MLFELLKNSLRAVVERYGVENEGDFIYKTTDDVPILCIPDILHNGRRIQEMLITSTHSLLAHLGYRKTLFYMRESVWWKDMAADVRAYCESCIVCKTSKSATAKPRGLLKTLPIPSRPWQSIGIDFVGPLPESTTREGTYDYLCVIIDHLT